MILRSMKRPSHYASIAVLLGIAAGPTRAHAQGQSEVLEQSQSDPIPLLSLPWLVRLHASAGWSRNATLDGDSTVGYTSGAQLMLPANADQSFGVEVSYVQTDERDERRTLAAGLFIEQRTFGWFLSGIGGVGHFLIDNERPVNFGISTKLGWAPILGAVSPFAVVRSDWIFDDSTISMTSLDVGLTIAIDP